MKSKISTQEIILKQKEQEEKERKSELNDKIIWENQQQTKNSNIKKENNIKAIKQLQQKKDILKKRISEINLHRQQNKETQQTEYQTISIQPTENRPGKRKERKYKNTGNERNKEKNMLCM